MATPFLLRAMLSKSLIQFSDGHSCVLSLLFDLRPNYGGSNEDNSDLLQKVPCTHSYTRCPQPCSRSLLTQTSTRDSWTLTSKSRSVSCGVTAPFSWVLVCTRFCLCPPRVCFPVLWKFWRLYSGVNGDLLQDGLCYAQFYCTQSPCPCSSPLLTGTSAGDIKHSSVSVSVGSLDSGVHKVCLNTLSVSGGYGVWFLTWFHPLLPSCWGVYALGRGVSSHSPSSAMQPLLPACSTHVGCW